MYQYLGLAVILCGFPSTSSFFYFDSRYREARSVHNNAGQSPLINFFNPFNLYPSLSSQYLQAQRDLLNGNRRRYRYPGQNRDKPVINKPEVIPDPDPHHHTEPHVDPIPQPEPKPEPPPVVQPTGPIDTDPECIQGCEANIASERCHCAAHLCDTISCTNGDACRLVTVGGLVEGTCLPIDSTTGTAPGQDKITHSISGCGLSLSQGSPCGRTPIQRFYFDINTQSCLPFQYTGCGGNDNNYHSASDCETTCHSQHIAPGVIDHHNSPTGSLPVSHGHAHPDHIEPVGTHGHGHPGTDHHEPVPQAEPQTKTPVVQPTGPVDTDPECIQGCEANIASERCHCAAHLCDTISCTNGDACRLVTVGGLVEGTCLPIDSTTGTAPGQDKITHSISGCGLSLSQGTPCGRTPIQRFYFDINTQSCLPFQYTGCGGNDNNYNSQTDCETTCHSQHIAPGVIDHHNSPTGSLPVSHGHAHPDHIEPVGTHGHEQPNHGDPIVNHDIKLPVSGNDPPECHAQCKKALVPESCHCSEHLCDRVTCTGKTVCRLMREMGRVEAMCIPVDPSTGKSVVDHHPKHLVPNACGKPMDRGRCGPFGTRRYFFDLEKQTCRRFRFSGCGGNANRFLTKKACEDMCMETRSTPGIIDHHNDPSLDPSLILGQPTHHGPIEHNQARGIDQHHTGRIISPLIPGRIAILRHVQPDTGHVDHRAGDSSHSNSHSAGNRTPFTISGMDIRRLMGQLLTRRTTFTPSTFGLTSLNRPRYGYRRPLGASRVSKNETPKA